MDFSQNDLAPNSCKRKLPKIWTIFFITSENILTKIICLFSLFLGSKDSISAELLAIHKACDIIQASRKWNGVKVVISSDPLVAVSWVNGEDVGSLEHAYIIFDIHNWLKRFPNLVVSYASRYSNFFADSLAKQGARNCGDFVQFMDS
ncbi:hypothetical protein Dsin_015016 [Dipteronia sinensis]|uniref:RNase H type-1 domain-containing protein n=1 Tax=Dipteronia sinensis TaxID=43782 RepID=A0AAE0EAF7_9ROSI|nr:hypothetical protein Dsin_015016 [Dipteronia sinensis]